MYIRVFVQPKASKNEICGVFGDEIKIRITEPPVDGKANQGIIQYLSKIFRVPKSKIVLLNGETSRHKRFCIHAPQQLPDLILPSITT